MNVSLAQRLVERPTMPRSHRGVCAMPPRT